MTINIATKMLEESMKAISDRQAKYGPPNKNFECIAELWEAYLRGKYGEVATIAIDSADVAAMSGLIKVARLAETPDHEDSWVDLAGYAACGRQVTASKKRACSVCGGLYHGDTECVAPLGGLGFVGNKEEQLADARLARAHLAQVEPGDAVKIKDPDNYGYPKNEKFDYAYVRKEPDYRFGDTAEMQTTGPLAGKGVEPEQSPECICITQHEAIQVGHRIAVIKRHGELCPLAGQIIMTIV